MSANLLHPAETTVSYTDSLADAVAAAPWRQTHVWDLDRPSTVLSDVASQPMRRDRKRDLGNNATRSVDLAHLVPCPPPLEGYVIRVSHPANPRSLTACNFASKHFGLGILGPFIYGSRVVSRFTLGLLLDVVIPFSRSSAHDYPETPQVSISGFDGQYAGSIGIAANRTVEILVDVKYPTTPIDLYNHMFDSCVYLLPILRLGALL